MSSEPSNELNRDIGLVGAIAIGVGTMIAGGIFVLSGLAVSNVGAAAIVSFLLAAVVASFTAAAYAEFATIYPVDGGGYAYVANVLESNLSYFVGWLMILGYPASAAFYLTSFSDWFVKFLAPALSLSEALPFWLPGVVALVVLTGVNLLGTEETSEFQVVVTAIKIALIVLFLAGGLQAFDADVVLDSLSSNATHLRDVGLTSALVFITFFGFEAIATSEGEIQNPEWTVPRAIFGSIVLVTVLYTLVVLVLVFAMHDAVFLDFLANKAGLQSRAAAEQFIATHGEAAMGRAAQYYLGDAGFYVFVVGALLSMVSAANATILAGSRVKLAMARRDHLPERFKAVRDTTGAPMPAVLLTGGLIFVYIMLFAVVFNAAAGTALDGIAHLGLDSLAHFADFMLLGGLIFVNGALILSRRRHPERQRDFAVPFVPWVPLLAIGSNLALIANIERTSLGLGIVAATIGVVFWFAVVE